MDTGNSSSTEAIYYSEVDSSSTPANALPQSTVLSKDDFNISQCAAYEANIKEEASEVTREINNDFTFSQNEAYKEWPAQEQSSQTSSEESMYYCGAYSKPSDTDSIPSTQAEEVAIYQCPAYISNETDDENENAANSYHYARGNFALDLDMLNNV